MVFSDHRELRDSSVLCTEQCFVDDSQSASGAKTSSQAELRDTVMALRLREASLVSDVNAVKRRLIELETQVCSPPSVYFSLELGNLHQINSNENDSCFARIARGQLTAITFNRKVMR